MKAAITGFILIYTLGDQLDYVIYPKTAHNIFARYTHLLP